MESWFLIYTAERKEAVARDSLMREGFATFLPEFSKTAIRAKATARTRRGERSALAIVWLPLFPRYLFSRFDPEAGDLSLVGKSDGVECVVRAAGRAAVVPDSVVSDVAGACALGLFNELPEPRFARPEAFREGQPVKMIGGPFADFVGKIKALPHGQRVLVVLAAATGGSVTVSVPIDRLARA